MNTPECVQRLHQQRTVTDLWILTPVHKEESCFSFFLNYFILCISNDWTKVKETSVKSHIYVCIKTVHWGHWTCEAFEYSLRTGCMVPPATITALASDTTSLKWTAGFSNKNFKLDLLRKSATKEKRYPVMLQQCAINLNVIFINQALATQPQKRKYIIYYRVVNPFFHLNIQYRIY